VAAGAAGRYLAAARVRSRTAKGGTVEDRSQEHRKHVFAVNGSLAFLNVVRELFQEEAYNVTTTTNYVPNSFAQAEEMRGDRPQRSGDRSGMPSASRAWLYERKYNSSFRKSATSASPRPCSSGPRSMR
jgi:hypothetical protein